ncbi:MAG: hypothetical protein EPO68_08545 [Planctomycetota bacterium]|nr:MAG: hypothetical protein EPO68_08545 [Planctomycetota bacterium]
MDAGWYARVAVIALTGAWSTALLHAKLVVEPAVGLANAGVNVLYFGTPSAVFAFVFLTACLRRRRWATAVPFLFASAWLPILICAACEPRENMQLAVFGWVASLGAFFAGTLCVELPIWSGFELQRRTPRDTRTA